MSTTSDILNVRRRLRDDALQMGPRKKMYDLFFSTIMIMADISIKSDALLIRLSIMAVTLAALFMHSATFML